MQLRVNASSHKQYDYDFTVRLRVMQRTVLLSEFCLSVCLFVCLSHACIVTKLDNALRIFWYHAKRQSL